MIRKEKNFKNILLHHLLITITKLYGTLLTLQKKYNYSRMTFVGKKNKSKINFISILFIELIVYTLLKLYND